jgi:hypothetical protein
MIAVVWHYSFRLIILALASLLLGMMGVVLAPSLAEAVDYETHLTTPPFDELFTNNPTGEDAVALDVITDELAVRNDA